MISRKSLARRISRWAIFRWPTLLVIKIVWFLDRVWSHLRFRALVPQAGDAICHWSVEIKCPHNLEIADHVRIGPGAVLGAASPIVIEENVVVSRGAVIETAGLDLNQETPYPHTSKPIIIERNAWIATNAVILGGVTIGEGALIGAGVVIGRDVAAFAIVKTSAPLVHHRSGRVGHQQVNR